MGRRSEDRTVSKTKAFYDFMIERELIRQRRRAGRPMSEWTADPIFQTYSFTNVKRHHDRTTTLLKNEFYDPAVAEMDGEDGITDGELKMLLLNCGIFRFFGTIETARRIGWSRSWDAETRARIMTIGPGLGFTAAYIVTSAGRSDPKYSVVCEFIDALWSRTDQILTYETWEGAVDEMTECYGIGPFMAKEIYLDYLLASGIVPTDWQTWTPVGPGGRRGASRIKYGIPDKIPDSEALEVIRDLYAQRDEYWPETFDGGEEDRQYTLPRLDLTDVQFQLCEFDKYSRVAEGRRPKRLFRPTYDHVTTAASGDN